MGANSSLNAGRRLPWLAGIIMLPPYDPTRYLNCDKEVYLRSLLEEGRILHSDGIDAIYEDVLKRREEISHPNAFEDVKDKNILVFAGKYDSVSPIEEKILPLWNKLNSHKTNAIQKLVKYPTEHGLIGRRISMICEIADFIETSTSRL